MADIASANVNGRVSEDQQALGEPRPTRAVPPPLDAAAQATQWATQQLQQLQKQEYEAECYGDMQLLIKQEQPDLRVKGSGDRARAGQVIGKVKLSGFPSRSDDAAASSTCARDNSLLLASKSLAADAS